MMNIFAVTTWLNRLVFANGGPGGSGSGGFSKPQMATKPDPTTPENQTNPDSPENAKPGSSTETADPEVAKIQSGVADLVNAEIAEAEQLSQLINSMDKSKQTVDWNNNMAPLIADLKATAAEAGNEEQTGQELKLLLNGLVESGKLTPAYARAILNLKVVTKFQDLPNGRDRLKKGKDGKIKEELKIDAEGNFRWPDKKVMKAWDKITKGLDKETEKKLKIAKEKQHKEILAKAAELKEPLHKFRELMAQAQKEIYMRADREDSIKALGKTTGLALAVGTDLTYWDSEQSIAKTSNLDSATGAHIFDHKKASAAAEERISAEASTAANDNKSNLPKKKFVTTIEDLIFQEIPEVDDDGKPKLDAAGKPITKKTAEPVIVLKIHDPFENKFIKQHVPVNMFRQWVEHCSVTERIESIGNLKTSLNEDIKPGFVFEYQKNNDASTPNDLMDIQVQIKEIKDGVDAHGQPTQIVVLDKFVMVDPHAPKSTGLKNELTLAEFAKWYKRNDTLRQLTSLAELCTGLTVHNESLNKKRKRKPEHYPPIKCEKDEVLFYENDSGDKYIIKDVDENGVTVNYGPGKNLKMTLTGFLRWVRKNEVEKLDADAEADKIVNMYPESTPAEKEAKSRAREEAKNKVLAGITDRRNAMEPPPQGPNGPGGPGGAGGAEGPVALDENGNPIAASKTDPAHPGEGGEHGAGEHGAEGEHPGDGAGHGGEHGGEHGDAHGGGHGEHGGEHGDHGGHAHHPYDPTKHSAGYFRSLWMDTNFMSLHNIFEMGKTIVEFIKRKLHRREHGVVGAVGEKMFNWWTELGAEFKGVAQHAENEEVGHHVEHMKTMGIEVVKHELHEAANKDILKAAITVLCDKGQMRWDDHGFWDRMNHFGRGALTDPKTGQPLLIKQDNHMEAIGLYLDKWFGQDTFREFRGKQDGAYSSVMNQFKDQAARLEQDPENNGGLRFALKNMLWKHLHGEYVNAAEYECYLTYAINEGKISFEDKIFFLVMAIGAPAKGAHGHPGMTLFHVDRASKLGELTNKFPVLDYFTSKGDWDQFDEHGHEKFDKNGQRLKGKIQLKHFEDMIEKYIKKDFGCDPLDVKDPDKMKFGKNFRQFVHEGIVWDPATRVRMEKAQRNPQNWDHDDMHVFGTMFGEQSMKQFVLRQGGSIQAISNPGLRNILAGFNEYTRMKIDMLGRSAKSGDPIKIKSDVKDLTQLMKSFIRFDAFLDTRYDHGEAMVRFGDTEYGAKAGISDKPVLLHVMQERNLIGGLARKFDQLHDSNLSYNWRLTIGKGIPREEQKTAHDEFLRQFEGAIAMYQDKPAELIKIIEEVQAENDNSKYGRVSGFSVDNDRAKSKEDEVTEEMLKLNPYNSDELRSLAQEIRFLEKKKEQYGDKDVAQVTRERDERYEKVMQYIQEGDFFKIDPESDKEILEKKRNKLKAEIAEKIEGKKKEKPALASKIEIPEQAAANDNSAAPTRKAA